MAKKQSSKEKPMNWGKIVSDLLLVAIALTAKFFGENEKASAIEKLNSSHKCNFLVKQ